MTIQRTLVLVKPDAFKKRIWYKALSIYRIESLKITRAKFIQPNQGLMEELYHEHREKKFFSGLISFMTSGLILAICLKGDNAIEKVRAINEAIRENYASPEQAAANVVHGSDRPESAERELGIFFGSISNL